MNAKTRTAYFALWTKVRAVQGWDRLSRSEQEEQRRAVTLQVMQAIGAGDSDSTTRLTQAEITALFTFLHHLAEPDNLTLAKLWTDCMADYKAFNMSKQADWHERRAYGRQGSARLHQQRFQGRDHAVQDDFSRPLNRREAEQRLMTMRARAGAHDRQARAGELDAMREAEDAMADCPF